MNRTSPGKAVLTVAKKLDGEETEGIHLAACDTCSHSQYARAMFDIDRMPVGNNCGTSMIREFAVNYSLEKGAVYVKLELLTKTQQTDHLFVDLSRDWCVLSVLLST